MLYIFIKTTKKCEYIVTKFIKTVNHVSSATHVYLYTIASAFPFLLLGLDSDILVVCDEYKQTIRRMFLRTLANF